MGSHSAPSALEHVNLDALVIGCGFGGIYQLKRLTDLGLKCLAIDAASDAGVSSLTAPYVDKLTNRSIGRLVLVWTRLRTTVE